MVPLFVGFVNTPRLNCYDCTMRALLTYNTQYGKNLSQINKWIEGLPKKPDVICLQEYPYDHLDNNSLAVQGYRFEFAPGLVKRGRTFSELTAFKSDLSLVASEVIDLGVSNLGKRVFRLSGQRSALITKFRAQGEGFAVANIHLEWLAPHSARRDQISLILKALGDTQSALIVGDFNYSDLVVGRGLIDYLAKHGFSLAGDRLKTHTIFGVKHQLDYVFQRSCTIGEVKVIDVDFSDHLPMIVEFDVSK